MKLTFGHNPGSPLSRNHNLDLLLFYLGSFLYTCQVFGASSLPSPTPSASAKLSDFAVIQERNIFNPGRYARSSGRERRSEARSARPDSLTLTGVITYEKGTYAFFDSSISAYRKVAKAGDELAGFKIAEVHPDQVRLVAGTNDMALEVGGQLRKEESGEWRISSRVEFASASTSPQARPVSARAGSAASSEPDAGGLEGAPDGSLPAMTPGETGSPNGEGAPPGEGSPPAASQEIASPAPAADSANSQDEVLRRLIQRREQEMNQ